MNMHVATYVEPIHPMGNDTEWVVPTVVRDINVKPFRQRLSAGHLRKQKNPPKGEDVVSRRCNYYLQVGHNRATCKNLVPLSPS